MKDRCASPYFRTFFKFCWNKFYILGCLYIVYNILDIWTLCGGTEKYYRTLHVTNNDADQLYDMPTVIQLIKIDRGCTDIWGCMDLGGIWMYGDIQISSSYGGI